MDLKTRLRLEALGLVSPYPYQISAQEEKRRQDIRWQQIVASMEARPSAWRFVNLADEEEDKDAE